MNVLHYLCDWKDKCSLTFAAKKRKDDVYSRLISEFKSLDEVQAEILKYHKSCYKSYTSKLNLEKFSPENIEVDVSDIPSTLHFYEGVKHALKPVCLIGDLVFSANTNNTDMTINCIK